MAQNRLKSASLGALLLLVPAIAHADADRVITVPGFADFLVVEGDAVWATNKGRIERWTLAGKTAEVTVDHPCGAMAIDRGALWVADCDRHAVLRIDLASAKVTDSVATGIANGEGELNVVAGAGAIWVASDAKGAISRIDPATRAVIATIAVDADTTYLAWGFDALWAVSPTKRTLQRINPRTNQVDMVVPLGDTPGFLVAGEGAVWVQEQGDGTLARVDPASGAVTARTKVGANLKWGDIDAGGGHVWLRTTDDQEFAVIDPKTGAVGARVGAAAGSGALRFTVRGIWTTAHDQHTLSWWALPAPFAK